MFSLLFLDIELLMDFGIGLKQSNNFHKLNELAFFHYLILTGFFDSPKWKIPWNDFLNAKNETIRKNNPSLKVPLGRILTKFLCEAGERWMKLNIVMEKRYKLNP